MGSFSYSTGKHTVVVTEHTDHSTSIKTIPKDFKSDGAAEVSITRDRGDDGSVTITVVPKPPAWAYAQDWARQHNAEDLLNDYCS